MNEIWKNIKDYEGLYQISNLGRVRSLKRNNTNGKILKTAINKRGYVIAYFSKNNKKYAKKIHRLVAEAFIDNLENKSQVNHIDGNKQNNNINNLEWVSQSENCKHAYQNKLFEKQRNNARKKLSEHSTAKIVNQLDKNGNFIKKWYSIKEAGIFFGNDKPTSIVNCCKGRNKTAYGFKWEYAKE